MFLIYHYIFAISFSMHYYKRNNFEKYISDDSRILSKFKDPISHSGNSLCYHYQDSITTLPMCSIPCLLTANYQDSQWPVSCPFLRTLNFFILLFISGCNILVWWHNSLKFCLMAILYTWYICIYILKYCKPTYPGLKFPSIAEKCLQHGYCVMSSHHKNPMSITRSRNIYVDKISKLDYYFNTI